MAITIKHAKTDNIADWTQADLDAQIALGNYPPGTVLADIVLPSDWNNDHTISGTVPIANGGTGQTTATAATNALLPSQTGNSGKVLGTDGTNTSWVATSGTGTVTSVGFSAPSIFSVAGSPITAAGTIAMTYSGTALPVANGGTGQTSYTDGQLLIGNSTGNTLSKATLTAGSGVTITNGSGTITIASTGSMTYPGAGIPNSTGSAWGTSYSTTGSGTVVALQTGASLSNPTISNYEDFTSTSAPSYTAGRLWYDSTQKALTYFNDVTNNQVHIGQEVQLKVINNTGSTIANGVPVYVTSTSSGASYPNVALAQANSSSTAAVIGLTNGSIANGAVGYVVTSGLLTPANTGSFAVGDVLYLSPYSAGQMMNTVPPTGYAVQIGTVAYANTPNGSIYIKQTTPLAVSASTLVGQVALANGGTNANLTAVNGGAVYSTGSALAITAAGTSGQVLTSSGAGAPTWTTPTTGTVTSVTGTSPIASSGGNTPAISISQATTSTNGYLSSTDWNTFNNKQPAGTYVTSVSATSPVTSSGGTTPTIAMPAATGSVNGYLTSTDWTTFNNKGSGTVTSVSVVSANGFAGTVATATTTPAITLTTSITGLLKGNGTAISAATSGTDYAPATSGSSILYGNGSGGFSNVTVSTGLSFTTGTLTNSSPMTYPSGSGIAVVSSGTSWGTTLTAPSGTIVGTTDTQTLTNKRVTPRVSTTTSSATPTINTDNVDIYGLTAQTANITSFTTNLSGTPTDGQKLWIYIVGTAARTITWGAKFESSTVILPATTVTTNRLDVGFVWNAASSVWRCVAVA